jgi:hypothetical protein
LFFLPGRGESFRLFNVFLKMSSNLTAFNGFPPQNPMPILHVKRGKNCSISGGMKR